jgi:hypothetical protein
VSGVGDGATYSAREYITNGLLYALEPRQPIAMRHKIRRIGPFYIACPAPEIKERYFIILYCLIFYKNLALEISAVWGFSTLNAEP